MGLLDNLLNSLGNNLKSVLDHNARQAANDLAKKAKDGISKAVTTKTRKVELKTLPHSLDELMLMPESSCKDPYATVALAVAALNEYHENAEEAFKMLDYLNGPDELNPASRQFIEFAAMNGRDYVARSYFKGATPENNYTPTEPYTVTISQNSYGDDSLGYLVLWVESGGADSPREVQLRLKPSTQQWFISMWKTLLADVRTPKTQDPWA